MHGDQKLLALGSKAGERAISDVRSDHPMHDCARSAQRV
jgi:hypothetical protein